MNDQLDTTINTGVIIQDPSPYDFIQGEETGIVFEERQANGDWTSYLPGREPQKYKFDTNECVTLSLMNVLEIQFNYLAQKGLFSPEAMDYFRTAGYFDANNSFAFSERFSAILNGTTIGGNSHQVVWNSLLKVGLLPRQNLDYSLDQSNQFGTQQDMCNDYYNPAVVTQEMKDKALKILDYVDIKWEWVAIGAFSQTPTQQLVTALRQSPVHVGTPVCPTWNSGNVLTCPSFDVQHATTVYGRMLDGRWEDFDHYNPYTKTFAADYTIPYAVKGVVTIKAPIVPPQPFSYHFTEFLQLGSSGTEVVALQKALIAEGILRSDLATGYFGHITQAAVKAFQEKYASEILTPLGLTQGTGEMREMTINKLNELYNK